METTNQIYYQITPNGYYLGPVISDEKPEDCVETPLPQPNWMPRWNGTEWIEERPDPENGKLWNSATKEWDLDPPEPAPDYAAFLRGLMEEMNDD